MKLQLGVKLIGDKMVEMTIIYICEEAIKNDWTKENKIFQDDNGITVWSFSDFIFDNRQIRLPQRNFLLTRLKHKHQFKSEEERYDVLKKFYTTLTRWSLNTSMFPNTNTDIKHRVIISNDYWSVI